MIYIGILAVLIVIMKLPPKKKISENFNFKQERRLFSEEKYWSLTP